MPWLRCTKTSLNLFGGPVICVEGEDMIYGELQLKISIYLLLSYHDLISCGWSLIEQIWTVTLKWQGMLFTCTRIKNLLPLVSLHLNHLFSGIHLSSYIIKFNWQFQVVWMAHSQFWSCSNIQVLCLVYTCSFDYRSLNIYMCLLVSLNSFNFCFFFHGS